MAKPHTPQSFQLPQNEVPNLLIATQGNDASCVKLRILAILLIYGSMNGNTIKRIYDFYWDYHTQHIMRIALHELKTMSLLLQNLDYNYLLNNKKISFHEAKLIVQAFESRFTQALKDGTQIPHMAVFRNDFPMLKTFFSYDSLFDYEYILRLNIDYYLKTDLNAWLIDVTEHINPSPYIDMEDAQSYFSVVTPYLIPPSLDSFVRVTDMLPNHTTMDIYRIVNVLPVLYARNDSIHAYLQVLFTGDKPYIGSFKLEILPTTFLAITCLFCGLKAEYAKLKVLSTQSTQCNSLFIALDTLLEGDTNTATTQLLTFSKMLSVYRTLQHDKIKATLETHDDDDDFSDDDNMLLGSFVLDPISESLYPLTLLTTLLLALRTKSPQTTLKQYITKCDPFIEHNRNGKMRLSLQKLSSLISKPHPMLFTEMTVESLKRMRPEALLIALALTERASQNREVLQSQFEDFISVDFQNYYGKHYFGLATLVDDLNNAINPDKANLQSLTPTPAETLQARFITLTPRIIVEQWKDQLVQIEACFAKVTQKKKATTKVTASEIIVWHIDLDYCQGGYRLFELEAHCCKLKKDGSYTKGKLIKWEKLHSGEYDAIMTEEDRTLIRQVVIKTGYYYRQDEYRLLPGFTQAICAVPNIYIIHEHNVKYDSSDDSKNTKNWVPVQFTSTTVPLLINKKTDGTFIVQLPLDLDYDQKVVFIKHEQKSDAYLVYAITPEITKFSKLIDLQKNRTINLPIEAEQTLVSLTRKIAEHQTLTGSFIADKNVSVFERLTAVCALEARLSFHHTALHLCLVNHPVESLSLTHVPGLGSKQEIVSIDKDKQVLLVRNLKQESKVADQIVAQLPDLSENSIGSYEWEVNSILDTLETIRSLKAVGIPMVWPKGKGLNLSEATTTNTSIKGMTSASEWLAIQGSFKLDSGKILSIVDVLNHMDEAKGRYVPIDDQTFLVLTNGLLKRLKALKAAGTLKKDHISLTPASVPALMDVFKAEDGGKELFKNPKQFEDAMQRFDEAFSAKYTMPTHFNCTLRSYQEEGYIWLRKLAACQLGACLADDMGLGKTIQLIALLISRAKEGPALVVAPASVAGNWFNEIKRFAPTLSPVIFDGSDITKDAIKQAKPYTVLLVTYGLTIFHEEILSATTWHTMILDEAQAIKNATAKRTQAVKRFKADFRIIATGTPIENRLSELWSLFDFINPGMLSTLRDFNKRYEGNDRPTATLRRLVAPFILRRLKNDVLSDLPEKTEITLPIFLDDDERHAYEGLRIDALERLQSNAEENKIQILAALTKLRRFCCHPTLSFPDYTGSATKLKTVLNLLHQLKEAGHRVLVFSQFTGFLTIVHNALKNIDDTNYTTLYLDGSTPKKERTRLTEAFQRGEADAFLISLKAGGMGLTLTEANYVILLDPWWNPAVENQAADRTHRIGQKKAVTIYRLITKDTVEERVLALHNQKSSLAGDILEGTSSSALSTEILMELFKK